MSQLISVIVPVYNVEQYLRDCMMSLIQQSYGNIEIVLVDDGSTDGSAALCDEYGLLDQRVRVFHKTNGGLSDARNFGLAEAKGELVAFVDSDDYVSSDYIKNLYNTMMRGNTSIAATAICAFIDGCVAKGESSSADFRVYSAHEALEDMLYMRSIEPNAFPKLYKKELFNSIEYPVGKLYEDIATTAKLIDKAGDIAYSKYEDYFYRIRSNSIQTSSFSLRKMDLFEQLTVVKELVEKKYPDIIDSYYSKEQSALFNIYMNLANSNNKFEYADIADVLWGKVVKNRVRVIKDNKARKDARIASILSFIGPRICEIAYRIARQ